MRGFFSEFSHTLLQPYPNSQEHHRPRVTKYEPADPEPDSKSLPV